MRTITRLYDRYSTAQQVVRDLEAAGIPQAEISIVANESSKGGTTSPASGTDASTGAGSGAIAGTVIGGGLGLLAGIGSLAIPGVGPVVAAGWLVATLTGAGIGATAGGLVGALTAAGVSREEADIYAEEIRRGGSLVSVRAPEDREAAITAIMDRHDPRNWQSRRGTTPATQATSGPPPESRVTDAAVPAADRTLTNRPADRLDNAGARDRRVMETASRSATSLDDRLDAAEERLRERRPSGPEATGPGPAKGTGE